VSLEAVAGKEGKGLEARLVQSAPVDEYGYRV
jgi:hypothetical protein